MNIKPLFTVVVLTGIIFTWGCGNDTQQQTKAPSKNSTASQSHTSNSQEEIIPSDLFTEPDTCGSCHSQLFSQWKGSMHNNAQIDPIYQKVVAQASKETGGSIDSFCSRCHTPIGTMAGEVPPLDGSKASAIAQQGIQCDFCHTVSDATGVGNGAFKNQPGAVKRGPLKDAKASFHQTEYSDLHTKAEFCGMCHDVSHPGNNLPLEATYTEWKNGPYAAQGIVCQDCHMTPGPGVTKPNPGKAVDFGPDREHIFTHNIVGGNFAVPALLGNEEHANLAKERLEAAAKVSIPKDIVKKNSQGLEFQVKVENVGAGHYLPTGLTETREMWLEVTVTDHNGKILWQSGILDNHGNIQKGSVIYRTVLADKNGKATDKVWAAEKLLEDHRIPPQSSVMEKYTVPAGVVGDNARVTARLLYRSAPQHVIDELFEDKTFEVPVLEMTKGEVRI